MLNVCCRRSERRKREVNKESEWERKRERLWHTIRAEHSIGTCIYFYTYIKSKKCFMHNKNMICFKKKKKQNYKTCNINPIWIQYEPHVEMLHRLKTDSTSTSVSISQFDNCIKVFSGKQSFSGNTVQIYTYTHTLWVIITRAQSNS